MQLFTSKRVRSRKSARGLAQSKTLREELCAEACESRGEKAPARGRKAVEDYRSPRRFATENATVILGLRSRREHTTAAFTLIELMVVVGIMGIILTIAIPGVYRFMHPNPMQKAVDDIQEACKNAREMAVMRGTITVLVIDLKGRTFSVQASSAPALHVDPMAPDGFMPEPGPQTVPTFESTGAGKTYQLSDRVLIEGLGINGLDYTEDERAEIRFYPKGTTDEFEIALKSEHDRRQIWLDSVTGQTDFEADVRKFRVHN